MQLYMGHNHLELNKDLIQTKKKEANVMIFAYF